MLLAIQTNHPDELVSNINLRATSSNEYEKFCRGGGGGGGGGGVG